MAKILLDEKPFCADECPFFEDWKEICKINNLECPCIGGYYDSRLFNFDECPYCKVYKNGE